MDSARADGYWFAIQSNSAVPRNRRGEAPGPFDSSSGAVESGTPSSFRTMPVDHGLRPEPTVAWPGAVSVTAWSW